MEPGRPLIESANHRNERQRRIRCPFPGIAALQEPRRESLMLVRLEKENTLTSLLPSPPNSTMSPPARLRCFLPIARFASEKCEQFYLRERVSA